MTDDKYYSTVDGMVTDMLRELIKTCGRTQYRIAADSDVDKATLCRFVHGGSCKVENVDKLFAYFNLVVVEADKLKR